MADAEERPRTYRFNPTSDRGYDPSGVSFHCLEDDLRYALKPSLAKSDARCELTLDRVTPQQIYDCFSDTRGRGSSHDLEHFIEMTGIELFYEGSRAVELVRAQERFFVSGVYPGSWHLDGTTLRQIPLPPDDSYEQRFSHSIVVPGSDHYIFRDQILNQQYTAELRARLQVLDRWLGAVIPGSGLSMENAQLETQVAILRLTAPIGWPPQPAPSGMTRSYLADRTLRFRAFAADLRRSILNGMNIILERFGNERGFTAKIEITGLRTAEEFENLRDALARGALRPELCPNYW